MKYLVIKDKETGKLFILEQKGNFGIIRDYKTGEQKGKGTKREIFMFFFPIKRQKENLPLWANKF